MTKPYLYKVLAKNGNWRKFKTLKAAMNCAYESAVHAGAERFIFNEATCKADFMFEGNGRFHAVY